MVCTNKKQFLAEKVLAGLNLSSYFNLIVGSRPELNLKPDTEMLELCIRESRSNFSETLMIGDSHNDIIPSRKLKIKPIFAEYGYGTIQSNKKIDKIKKFDEILNFI